MIAEGYSGYEYNERNYIQKETEFTSQARFYCFAKSKDRKDHGAFETIQEDLNDRNDIKSKIKSFFNKVEKALGEITSGVRFVTELIGTVKGIKKSIFSIIFGASSFLRFSYVLLLLLFILI